MKEHPVHYPYSADHYGYVECNKLGYSYGAGAWPYSPVGEKWVLISCGNNKTPAEYFCYASWGTLVKNNNWNMAHILPGAKLNQYRQKI